MHNQLDHANAAKKGLFRQHRASRHFTVGEYYCQSLDVSGVSELRPQTLDFHVMVINDGTDMAQRHTHPRQEPLRRDTIVHCGRMRFSVKRPCGAAPGEKLWQTGRTYCDRRLASFPSG